MDESSDELFARARLSNDQDGRGCWRDTVYEPQCTTHTRIFADIGERVFDATGAAHIYDG
jgi:hypothetical protein